MLKYPTDRGPKVPDTQETLRAVRDLCGVTALWFKNPWSTEIACGLRPWGPCQVDLNCIISVDRSGEPQEGGSVPVDRIYQWDHSLLHGLFDGSSLLLLHGGSVHFGHQGEQGRDWELP